MNRALPADRLIREAIDRYREQQDFTGLGWAQKFYGDFVRSAAFAEWPQFRDLYPDTATPERRRALAHQYYSDAIASFRTALAEKGVPDEKLSTNFYLIYLTYLTYRADDDRKGACDTLEAMAAFARAAIARSPGTKLAVPKPYPSGDEFESAASAELNCPAGAPSE